MRLRRLGYLDTDFGDVSMIILNRDIPVIGGTFRAEEPPKYATAYGVEADGSTNDTDAGQRAIDDCVTGDTLIWPSGTSKISNLTIPTRIRFRGQGQGKSILSAATGSTGTLIDCPNDVGQIEVGGFTLDLASAPTMVGLDLQTQSAPIVEDIKVNYGSIALRATATGDSFIRTLVLRNQTTAAIQIQGDSGGEQIWSDIDIKVTDASVTLAAGFEWVRTTSTDIGAYYLDRVRITRSAGTITYGFKARSTSSPAAALPIFMNQCVADNINGANAMLLENVRSMFFVNGWLSATGTDATDYTVYIDGGAEHVFNIARLYADVASAAFGFANAPSYLDFDHIRVPEGGSVFSIPASNPPTQMKYGHVKYDRANTALTNDADRLATACTSNHVNTTAVGNVGGGQDNLMAYTIPADTLDLNRKGVRITAWGVAANNSNPKTVKLFIGDVEILTRALTASQACQWWIEAIVVRNGLDSQKYVSKLSQGGTTSFVHVQEGDLTRDDGATIVATITGTVTDGGGGINNDDIVCEALMADYF